VKRPKGAVLVGMKGRGKDRRGQIAPKGGNVEEGGRAPGDRREFQTREEERNNKFLSRYWRTRTARGKLRYWEIRGLVLLSEERTKRRNLFSRKQRFEAMGKGREMRPLETALGQRRLLGGFSALGSCYQMKLTFVVGEEMEVSGVS